jgi:hypothetical protein
MSYFLPVKKIVISKINVLSMQNNMVGSDLLLRSCEETLSRKDRGNISTQSELFQRCTVINGNLGDSLSFLFYLIFESKFNARKSRDKSPFDINSPVCIYDAMKFKLILGGECVLHVLSLLCVAGCAHF